jgi:hypothetical protein
MESDGRLYDGRDRVVAGSGMRDPGGAGLYGRPLSLYARLSPAIEVVSAFRRTDSRCRGGPNHFGVDVEAIYGRRGTRVDERAV